MANQRIRVRLDVAALHSQENSHQQIRQPKVGSCTNILRDEGEPLMPFLAAHNVRMHREMILVLRVLLCVPAGNTDRQLLPKGAALVVHGVASAAREIRATVTKIERDLAVTLPLRRMRHHVRVRASDLAGWRLGTHGKMLVARTQPLAVCALGELGVPGRSNAHQLPVCHSRKELGLQCLEGRLPLTHPLLLLQHHLEPTRTGDWVVQFVVHRFPSGSSVLNRHLVGEPIVPHQMLSPPRACPRGPGGGRCVQRSDGAGCRPFGFRICGILAGDRQCERFTMRIGGTTGCCNECVPAHDSPIWSTQAPLRYRKKTTIWVRGSDSLTELPN